MDTPTTSDHRAPAPEAPNTSPGSPAPSGRSRGRRWLLRVVVAIVLVTAVSLGIWDYLKPTARITYVTASVSRGRVAPYVTASGSVNPVVTIQVGTYVSGVIQALYCDYNTRVKAGQLCARIDPRPYQVVVDQGRAALAAARAQLVKDEASLAYASATAQRQTRLLADGLTSQDAADSAHSAYGQARAQVNLDQATIKQRQADLQAAEVNLGYTRITSPVDGIVVTRNVTQGQTVAASFQTPTLFLIATNLTQMQVDTNVSESDIGQVKAADAATFTVEAFPAHVFQGRVTQVRQSPQTVQNVVTYDVVVSADNPQLLLKPGMTADVRIVTTDIPDALRVPVEALRFWPQSVPKPTERRSVAQEVWALRDGRPVAVAVTTGATDDVYAQIKSGALRVGEPVIVGERSSDGAQSGPASAPQRRSPFL